MALWNPRGARGPQNLSDLDLDVETIHKSLFAAVTDAQLNSKFDSPTAFGHTMWTRTNRYLREELVPKEWTIRNSKLILRTIHPSKWFAVTATSASGGVGDLTAGVQAKNPKGEATRKLITNNGTIPLVYGMEAVDSFDSAEDEIPTWFLLYKYTSEGVLSELSYPISMSGPYVDSWQFRLPVPPVDLGGLSDNSDGPDSGPDFTIEER